MTVKRRSMLKGLSLGAIAAMAPMLRNARAFAQSGEIPKRVVFFYTDTGNLPTRAEANDRSPGHGEPLPVAGMSEPTETQFELNTTMEPLQPFKQDLLLFENLDMLQSWVDPTPPGNAHFAGASITLTGANRFDGQFPGAISIDQLIAQQLNSPSPVTRLPSIELQCGGNARGSSEASAIAAGQTVPVLYEPDMVYDRLFPATADSAQAEMTALRRNRVFDFILGHGGGLRDRLAPNDREKLRQHLDTVSDLQARLALSGRDLPPPSRALLDPWGQLYDGYTEDDSVRDQLFHLSTDINLDLLAAALHADVTRVATVWVDDPPGASFGFTGGQHGATDPHDLQHKVNNIAEPQSSDPEAHATLARSHTLVHQKLASLLDRLAMRTESDGSRLLDHTLVVFCSQIANGSHELSRLPWLLAGSSNGYFRTGRYIRFARGPHAAIPDWADAGRPHNDLFVSIANAMGIDIATFGNPDICTGPITELRA
jgi:hypothetical protein